MNTRIVDWTSILDPSLALIVIGEPSFFNVNTFLVPLNSLWILSRTSSCPKCQPANESVETSCIVIWNSAKVLDGSVGIPVVPIFGTVRIWSSAYP